MAIRAQKKIFSCPKIGVFRPFLGKKWAFLGGAALNHPFSRFLTLQHMLLLCRAPAK